MSAGKRKCKKNGAKFKRQKINAMKKAEFKSKKERNLRAKKMSATKGEK